MSRREQVFFMVGIGVGLTIMWIAATLYLIGTGYLPV